MTRPVFCADVGSTYTKVAAVDADSGELLGTAAHRTTIDTDVLDGLDGAFRLLRDQGVAADLDGDVLVCSSAGGGLRLGVVGYERAVTAEAGYRVGLSAGARVVHVATGPLDKTAREAVKADRPDVILLVGGTDGGNAEVLLHNARALGAARLRCPVVVAGNADVRDDVVAELASRGVSVIATANVLPRIGVLDAAPARAAIREVFIRHVIGGKHLSKPDSGFVSLVRAATPDAVLAGVEALSDGAGEIAGVGDVLVVDVGGATTDVYSVVTPDPEEAALHREVVEVLWRGRTVEGDLGVRWNAPGIVEAAVIERLLGNPGNPGNPSGPGNPGSRGDADASDLAAAAAVRAADPSYLPVSDADAAVDVRLARLAATIACRRHARPQVVVTAAGESVRRPGKDLREVRLVVGSGGVLRHAPAGSAEDLLRAVLADAPGGWLRPERADVRVDVSYVLAAAGLLALDGRSPLAARLLAGALGSRRPPS